MTSGDHFRLPSPLYFLRVGRSKREDRLIIGVGEFRVAGVEGSCQKEVSLAFVTRPGLAFTRSCAGYLLRGPYYPQIDSLRPEHRMLRPKDKDVIVLDFSCL